MDFCETHILCMMWHMYCGFEAKWELGGWERLEFHPSIQSTSVHPDWCCCHSKVNGWCRVMDGMRYIWMRGGCTETFSSADEKEKKAKTKAGEQPGVREGRKGREGKGKTCHSHAIASEPWSFRNRVLVALVHHSLRHFFLALTAFPVRSAPSLAVLGQV